MNVAVPPQSPHLRLYDCAKSAIIKIFAFPYATVCYMLLSFMIFKQNPESNFTFIGCQMPKVCDLYCDSGMDTDKWCDAQVGHYIGIDASASGVNYARELWENRRKPFTAEFIELDPSDDGFEAQVQEKGIQADMVCCMQHLQSCFENEERAKKLLNNVSSLPKPGGYFFGITPDSSTIWTKYQKNVEAAHNKGLKTVPNSIRSENYTITFEEVKLTSDKKFPRAKLPMKGYGRLNPPTIDQIQSITRTRQVLDATGPSEHHLRQSSYTADRPAYFAGPSDQMQAHTQNTQVAPYMAGPSGYNPEHFGPITDRPVHHAGPSGYVADRPPPYAGPSGYGMNRPTYYAGPSNSTR
ncbi:hypothetical protein ACJX0J_023468, partial [Zea mays]